MEKKYKLVFDEVMVRQLKKLGKDKNIRDFLSKLLDKIEEMGPNAGKMIDFHLSIYEMKMKHPPIRLYYKHNRINDEVYIFEYEMKTSDDKQNRTIEKIKKKILEP